MDTVDLQDKIVQIIPAEGWNALFCGGTNGEIDINPIVCWALVEFNNGLRDVVGMVSTVSVKGERGLEMACENVNLLGYAKQGSDLSGLSEDLKEASASFMKQYDKSLN